MSYAKFVKPPIMSLLWPPQLLPSLDCFKEKLQAGNYSQETQQNAYSICLQLEKSTVAKTVMHARVLGYLILYAPNHAAQAEVARCIVDYAGDDTKLEEFGDVFVKGFINAFRTSRERTPTPSYHSGRPYFDRARDVLSSAQLEGTPKEHKDAKAQALIRDGYRCIISGVYDDIVDTQIPISQGEIIEVGVVNTQCIHIVPASTHFNVGVDDQGEPTDKLTASMLAVLKSFGYPFEILSGAGVHSLFNIMTVQSNVRDLFDRLKLWLEATETPHKYRIELSKQAYGPTVRHREFVTFTTSDPDRFPLPSPELLALHAACAKVANLSGALGYLDGLDRDMEGIGVLKTNGGSFEMLDIALWRELGSRIVAGA